MISFIETEHFIPFSSIMLARADPAPLSRWATELIKSSMPL